MTEREALEITLSVLERVSAVDDDCDILTHSLYVAVGEAIDFAKETLAQPEQEAYWERVARIKEQMLNVAYEENKLLKEYQPQRKPLTNNEIRAILDDPKIAERHEGNWLVLPYTFARAIEAAHGIKE